MPDAQTMVRDKIKIGMNVKIAVIKNQKEKDWMEGIITNIISDEDFNHDGVEVEISSGYIGNIKKIITKQSNEDVLIRIKDRENKKIEKKETFAYDVKQNKRNDELNKVISIAVASMLNTEGGYLYIGVDDYGNILGLDRDYRILEIARNDQLELRIKNALEKFLTNYPSLTRNIEISFPNIYNKEICEINIKPSNIPIYVKNKIYFVQIDGKSQQRLFDDFYIRDGNAKKLLQTHQDYLEYWIERFSHMGNR